MLREVRDALCLGISVLTGPMIHGAIRAAKAVKREAPDVPVIFGGWHPSLLPGQTLQENFVDAIVRGQGELTLLEIADRLAEKKPIQGVPGVSSKQFGLPQHAPERRVALLDDLPTPALEWWISTPTSASPASASSLTRPASVVPMAAITARTWCFTSANSMRWKPGRVVQEVTELVAKYRIDEVAMLDSNLPVDWRRARDIAQGFLDSKLQFPLDLSGFH